MQTLTAIGCVQLEARAAAARQAAEEAEQKRLHVEQQLHSFKPQVSSGYYTTSLSLSQPLQFVNPIASSISGLCYGKSS